MFQRRARYHSPEHGQALNRSAASKSLQGKERGGRLCCSGECPPEAVEAQHICDQSVEQTLNSAFCKQNLNLDSLEHKPINLKLVRSSIAIPKVTVDNVPVSLEHS
jgi:hypothetical protein